MANVAVALLLAICAGVVAVVALRAHLSQTRAPARPTEVGLVGVAMTALGPHGVVRVDAEEWSATVDGAPVAAGELIQVLGRRGLRLRVRRAGRGSAATDKAIREARDG